MRQSAPTPMARRKSKKPNSSVEDVTRHVNEPTKVMLAALTAGRCQYLGCNKLVYEHHLTKEPGNYGQRAHIVGFRKGGPRGRAGSRKSLNDLSNLMLLCPEDHKKIDDDVASHPRRLLAGWKRAHEERIRDLTSMGPEAQSHIVSLRALVGGHLVDEVAVSSVLLALRPLGLYPAVQRAHDIELTGTHDSVADFYTTAAGQVTRQLADLVTRKPAHISVFALAPIPLLVHLGSRISNKLPVEVFNRHRIGNTWRWSTHGTAVEFSLRLIRKGTNPKSVGLLVSISGVVELDTLPGEIDGTFSLYEIRPTVAPGRDLIRKRDDLARFREAYRRALEDILREHGTLTELHLFPAVPVSVGVVLGHDVLPKAHPSLWVYDNRQPKGFSLALKVDYDAE